MQTRPDLEHHLTKLVLDHNQQPPDEWWHDNRSAGGLRLTSNAYQCMIEDLCLDHYTFVMDAGLLTPRNLLCMSRFMTCPYFLNRKGKTAEITLFGDQEAVMANLYQDIEKFIHSLQPNE